jgi:ABC-type proline/glycine betaine transport system ATPase subunit
MGEESVGVSETQARATVSAREVWKVYGPHPERVVGSSDASLPRAELLERTGCVAAVQDVSFDVGAGEVFVVMGLSVSGKSTLIRMINRLHDPTSGQILVDGQDVLGLSSERLRELRRHKISMVFQHFGLLPHRRIVDNVAYGLEVQGVDKANRAAVKSSTQARGWGLPRGTLRACSSGCLARRRDRPRDRAVRRPPAPSTLIARHAGRGGPPPA